tara:strand:+ start:824 stop:1465 length:642 start_codon:yes stop_codon:yes gene_type:complete
MSTRTLPPYNIILFSGGKTAGSTLHKSFLHLSKYKPIHIHTNRCFEASQMAGVPPFIKNKYPKDIFHYIDKKKKVFIFEVYRNPTERKISSYFQNYKHNRLSFKVPNNISIDDEVDYFNINIYHHIENYESVAEVKKHYDIKLKDRGEYWEGTNKNINLIRLKFKYINNWESLIQEKLNDEDFKIINYNESKNKEYYDYYQKFKKIYLEKYIL